MKKKALFSKDQKYRYLLERTWNNSKKKLLFIMLNPSSADSKKDDPTIRRLISFSKKWGYGGFKVCNLYSYVTSSPSTLYSSSNILGYKNKSYIKKQIKNSDCIVYAWGNTEAEPHWLKKIVKTSYCIGINKNGTPKHPLYINSNAKLLNYK
ncbi:MAG: hypothetical protein CMD06_04690 [Flavobacteriales bacterium]|nr:hypothetical protein [Flavobacteriales bacterium]